MRVNEARHDYIPIAIDSPLSRIFIVEILRLSKINNIRSVNHNTTMSNDLALMVHRYYGSVFKDHFS